MQAIPPCFCDGNYVIAFLPPSGFQLLLFLVHTTCIGVNALHLGWWPRHFFFFFLEEEGVGKALIPIQPFLGISMISNSSISLVTLLLHGSPSPTFTGMGDQGTLPAHHPTESGILPPGLSLASLVSSLSPFNSSLKPFQWVLLTPEQRSSSPLETDESCLLPAGLALHKMTRDQKKN